MVLNDLGLVHAAWHSRPLSSHLTHQGNPEAPSALERPRLLTCTALLEYCEASKFARIRRLSPVRTHFFLLKNPLVQKPMFIGPRTTFQLTATFFAPTKSSFTVRTCMIRTGCKKGGKKANCLVVASLRLSDQDYHSIWCI